MTTTPVTFKIAMDAEQKNLKNFYEVSFEVSFDGVPPSLIQKHAIANQVVAWQSQIRSHWDDFLKGELPKVITFGQVLFGGTRGQKVITEDDMRTFLSKMTPDQIRALLTEEQHEEQNELEEGEEGKEDEEDVTA